MTEAAVNGDTLIGVTSQNRREVTAHAGRCRRFWVYRVCNGAIVGRELRELSKAQSFHDAEPNASHPLDDLDVLLVGGMGPGLAKRLARKGVVAQTTNASDPERAVKQYLIAH